MRKRLTKPPEVLRLKKIMAERDLTPGRLATLPGMRRFNGRRISHVLAFTDRTWPIRQAINSALGIQIFTRPETRRTVQPTTAPRIP